jgi:hypothetical protein
MVRTLPALSRPAVWAGCIRSGCPDVRGSPTSKMAAGHVVISPAAGRPIRNRPVNVLATLSLGGGIRPLHIEIIGSATRPFTAVVTRSSGLLLSYAVFQRSMLLCREAPRRLAITITTPPRQSCVTFLCSARLGAKNSTLPSRIPARVRDARVSYSHGFRASPTGRSVLID